jgi:hypothetical protein
MYTDLNLYQSSESTNIVYLLGRKSILLLAGKCIFIHRDKIVKSLIKISAIVFLL